MLPFDTTCGSVPVFLMVISPVGAVMSTKTEFDTFVWLPTLPEDVDCDDGKRVPFWYTPKLKSPEAGIVPPRLYETRYLPKSNVNVPLPSYEMALPWLKDWVGTTLPPDKTVCVDEIDVITLAD